MDIPPAGASPILKPRPVPGGGPPRGPVPDLGPGWLVLRNCPLGGDGPRIPLALLHPSVGVALVDAEDAGAADAAGRLRRALDARRFPAIFGGYPPIAHVVLSAGRSAKLGRAVSSAFEALPPLALAGGDAWLGTARAALEAEMPAAAPERHPARRQPVSRWRRGLRRRRAAVAVLATAAGTSIAALALALVMAGQPGGGAGDAAARRRPAPVATAVAPPPPATAPDLPRAAVAPADRADPVPPIDVAGGEAVTAGSTGATGAPPATSGDDNRPAPAPPAAVDVADREPEPAPLGAPAAPAAPADAAVGAEVAGGPHEAGGPPVPPVAAASVEPPESARPAPPPAAAAETPAGLAAPAVVPDPAPPAPAPAARTAAPAEPQPSSPPKRATAPAEPPAPPSALAARRPPPPAAPAGDAGKGVSGRCRDILLRATMGEELSDGDREHLRRGCQARN